MCCVYVCVPSSTSLLLFLLYNASLRGPCVSLFVYMRSRTLPTGLTRRPERRLTGDGAVKHADRQEGSKRGRGRPNGEVRGSNKAERLQCEGETFRKIPQLNSLCRGRAGAHYVWPCTMAWFE